jgi:cell division protein ZapA (FtsZ GTPase activity inhibitor)
MAAMTEDQLNAILNQQLAVFFGQVTKYVDKQVAELRTEVRSTHDDVNRVLGAVDDLVKHQETDDQERLAMTAQLDRQKNWITQLADTTNTKLVPEP